MEKRGRGWRGLKVPFRELSGSEGCWHQEDERPGTSNSRNSRHGHRPSLVRRGFRKYVKLRTIGIRFRFRNRPKGLESCPKTSQDSSKSGYHPTHFRHSQPHSTHSRLPDLSNLSLEIPDFELWINELWHDFLIEPTPYLVASAIIYLGFILLVSQYYAALWRVVCFLFQFVPWDVEAGLTYP